MRNIQYFIQCLGCDKIWFRCSGTYYKIKDVVDLKEDKTKSYKEYRFRIVKRTTIDEVVK